MANFEDRIPRFGVAEVQLCAKGIHVLSGPFAQVVPEPWNCAECNAASEQLSKLIAAEADRDAAERLLLQIAKTKKRWKKHPEIRSALTAYLKWSPVGPVILVPDDV